MFEKSDRRLVAFYKLSKVLIAIFAALEFIGALIIFILGAEEDFWPYGFIPLIAAVLTLAIGFLILDVIFGVLIDIKLIRNKLYNDNSDSFAGIAGYSRTSYFQDNYNQNDQYYYAQHAPCQNPYMQQNASTQGTFVQSTPQQYAFGNNVSPTLLTVKVVSHQDGSYEIYLDSYDPSNINGVVDILNRLTNKPKDALVAFLLKGSRLIAKNLTVEQMETTVERFKAEGVGVIY